MKHLRYFREFYDLDGVKYRVEILQESEQAYIPIEVELASDPVVIEWAEVMKIDPVMPAGATLRLISMSDRQFVDLYSVEPCTIRMDVYRAGTLYWSGTLDTELFEEPYAYESRYITSVTFSDFGVLDRLAWEHKGLKTIGEIVDICLSTSQIAYDSIEKMISTTIPNIEGDIFSSCLISLENFYDEDGEAWTCREVLDAVLFPFAFQLRQKNGKIYISDLNSLASLPTQDVKWLNADSMLGVEPTFNKAVIRFSPYSEAVLFDGEFNEDEILPNLNASGVSKVSVGLPDTDFNGFDFYYSEAYSEPTEVQKLTLMNDARIFRVRPDNNGQKDVGVMWGIRPTGNNWIGKAPAPLLWGIASQLPKIIQTPKIPMQSGLENHTLKVSLEVFYDVRFNPYANADESNDKKAWDRLNDWANYCLIPCSLIFTSRSGKTYTYDNRDIWEHFDEAIYPSILKEGRWVEGDWGTLWLGYYDQANRKSATGFGGWKTNNQSVGFSSREIPKQISLNLEGEKIPLPPEPVGELEFRICSGFVSRDNKNAGDSSIAADVATMLRWMLYRNPKIEIASESGKTIEVEDIVISGWINKSAEEEFSKDTYIGTPTERTPMARGAIISAKDYSTITAFKRAEVTTSLEKLLIGTVYSNYASRKNTLQGTIKLIAENSVLSDKSAVNSRYIIVSASENLEQATSEIKMAEFAEDSYEGLEYE